MAERSHWSWVRKLAPWLIAVVAMAAIAWRYPPSKIALEMQRGDVLATLPYALAIVCVAIFTISASDWSVVVGAIEASEHRRPSFLQLVRGRIGMTLLGMLGYGAGVGGHGVWLARVTGAGAGFTGGMVLYIMSTDLVAVSFVAGLSVWAFDVPQVAPILRTVAPGIAALLLALKLLGPRERLFTRDQLPAVFRPWAMISPRRALTAVGFRTANIYYITFCVWGAAKAFGMQVPMGVWFAYFPVILVVGSMPVNIAGFGAVQAAWLLFEPYADNGEQVIAFSVLWNLVIACFVLLRGLPFVRRVVLEIADGVSD
jgi:hypothetical protein